MTALESIFVTPCLVMPTQVHMGLRTLTASHAIPSVKHVNIYRRKKITLGENKIQLKHKASIYSGLLKSRLKCSKMRKPGFTYLYNSLGHCQMSKHLICCF
uniref:Uncharacterized protein n=2 Tax=Cercopithecinae TaxID=9528 RepID=A0A7N9CPG8_MACFA